MCLAITMFLESLINLLGFPDGIGYNENPFPFFGQKQDFFQCAIYGFDTEAKLMAPPLPKGGFGLQ